MRGGRPEAPVQRLYPAPPQELPIEGLYLSLDLHRQAADDGILIYANYITSLDGRISIRDGDGYSVPEAVANARDWRLYQELAAQADVLITSGRYFRQLAEGRAQAMLPVGTEYPDLLAWRRLQGLSARPAVAIVSRSLNIPVAALERMGDRDVYVFTAGETDAGRVSALQAGGVHVVDAGRGSVDGMELRQQLVSLGFRSACMIAGPGVHAMLLQAGALDRLFLSQRHVLLGGGDFHTIVEQTPVLAQSLRLLSLYHDAKAGQSFWQFSIS